MLDFHDENSYPNMVEALGNFNDGYRALNNGTDQAIKLFNVVKKINSNDKRPNCILIVVIYEEKTP